MGYARQYFTILVIFSAIAVGYSLENFLFAMAFYRRHERNRFQSSMAVFGVFMTVFYFGLGVYLFVDPSMKINGSSTLGNILGVLCFAYGLFRAARLYQDWRMKQQFGREDRDEDE